MSVRFSIFDWLDDTGRDPGDSYTERLHFVECADRLGLYAYHLAEHHGSELLVGSPATVRDRLGAYLQESRGNYFLGAFLFGNLSLAQATRSLELFAGEVMPALT